MKNTLSRLISFRLAISCLLMMGLYLVVPSEANAQLQMNAGTKYVSASKAIERLELKTSSLKGQIEPLTSGTLEYLTAVWKYELYDAVLNHLYLGKTVEQSVADGSAIYLSDAYASMPESMKKANRIELGVFLKP